MTSKEYNTIVAEIKERLAKLEAAQPAEDPPKPPHPRPYPEDGQIYFSFNGMGGVYESEWCSDQYDLDAREYGNVFFGKTAAEFAAERMKVLAEMREWAGNLDDPYILYYNHISRYVGTTYTQNTNLTYGEMRYATKADAEECVKAVGVDRVKKYYFMIPEGE